MIFLTLNSIKMPVFEIKQIVETDLATCWDFFSDPRNLAMITPPDMNFVIKYPHTIPRMYRGMIIRYTVSPMFKIPLEWVTEITQVENESYFVDNQIKGPFKLWHHQHIFKQTETGVEMTDIVNYELPFGLIGELTAKSLVEKRIENIFRFRRTVIDNRFKAQIQDTHLLNSLK
ncbi:MAG: SRPBCC family protein [Lentimicrobium sp.]|nr:SRPBCC family protein [Lentimicrobium sp.]